MPKLKTVEDWVFLGSLDGVTGRHELSVHQMGSGEVGILESSKLYLG